MQYSGNGIFMVAKNVPLMLIYEKYDFSNSVNKFVGGHNLYPANTECYPNI